MVVHVQDMVVSVQYILVISSGHANKWQDMLENIQDILVNLVEMVLNGRICL